MTIENVNTGICHRRIQTGGIPYFVNWQENGENKYFFGMRSIVEDVKNELLGLSAQNKTKEQQTENKQKK